MIGRMLGEYRVQRKIAEGGMGAVYEARRASDGQRAAVKVLLHGLENAADAAQRFLNEGRAVSAVAHSSLVKIYEYATSSDGEPYIAMEYLDGQSLRAAIEERYLGASALPLLRQLAAALAATHEKRIVHRDLKPENIMLVKDDDAEGGLRAKILDFGIAKLLPDGASEEERKSFKTRTGTLIGTPTYMSPEQCRASGPTDDRTDVYSLGVIAYELLDGEPPFVSDSAGELFALQMFGRPPPIKDRVPSLNATLATLIQRLLEKKPSDRPSMAELRDQLNAITSTGISDGPAKQSPAAQRKSGPQSNDGDSNASQELRRTLDTLSGPAAQHGPPPKKQKPAALLAGALAVMLAITGVALLASRARHPEVAPAPIVVPDIHGAESAGPTTSAGVAPPKDPPGLPVAPSSVEKPATSVRSHKDRPGRKGGRRGNKDADAKVDLWN
jgi:serine/threonine protein kinase